MCSGNICRSPIAAELLRTRARVAGIEDLVVDSAGTLGIDGAPAARETVDVAREIGLDLTSHRSKGVSEEAVRGADLVLVMEREHLDELDRRFPGPGRRLLLRAFEGGPEPRDDARDVDDPIGAPIGEHRACLGTIERCVDHVLAFLRRRPTS